MRILSNGYGIKLNPKDTCPKNYKQDPSDPMICIPVFICDHRSQRTVSENCCIPYEQLECNHFNKDIKIVDCTTCEVRSYSDD
jgi:hypothetical protein